MKYIERALHIRVRMSTMKELGNFPLYLKAGFDFAILKFEDSKTEYVLLIPKDRLSLPSLRSQVKTLETLTGKICVVQLEQANKYTERTLIEDGISFFVPGGTIYLPFLGAILTSARERQIAKSNRLSFLAQRLLLTVLYERFGEITVAKAARVLCVTEMSASRAFDSVEAVSLPFIRRDGRRRLLIPGADSEKYLETIWPTLRSPLIETYKLNDTKKAKGLPYVGLSAISHYSMLANGNCPIFAATREQTKNIPLQKFTVSALEDEPAAIVMLMRYVIQYGDGKAVDPISAILSLSNDEVSEPRIQNAIKEIKGKLIK